MIYRLYSSFFLPLVGNDLSSSWSRNEPNVLADLSTNGEVDHSAQATKASTGEKGLHGYHQYNGSITPL
jgi:hypothetical protein